MSDQLYACLGMLIGGGLALAGYALATYSASQADGGEQPAARSIAAGHCQKRNES